MKPQLANAPLCLTIVQIRFNPVTDLASYIAKIQDRFRKIKFDTFTEDMQPAIQLGEGGVQFKTQTSYSMGNFKGNECFALSADHMSFHTSNYSIYSDFKQVFLEGLKIVHSELDLSTSIRLGLRYINAISGHDVVETASFVDPSIMGFSVRDTIRDYTYTETRSSAGTDKLIIKTLVRDSNFMLPGDLQQNSIPVADRFSELKGFHVILDVDAFHDQPYQFDIERVGSKLDELHETAEIAFDSATTDEARGAWA